MIKGHSIIELKNVKTGKVERYEDDNLVTNGVAKYLEDMGAFNNSPIYANSPIRDNPIEQMFGGLLLFDSTLTESADTLFPPSGVKMIGNGAYNKTWGSQATENVRELGSWNSTESGWMSDGSYKMVWDFPTTQANGTIACACLTSASHGWVGEGNTSGGEIGYAERSSDYLYGGNSYDYFQYNDYRRDVRYLVHGSHINSTLSFIDYNNIVYSSTTASEHMGTTGKIKLKTYEVPISKFDLRQGISVYNSNGGQDYIPASEVEITLPNAFVSALGNRTPIHFSRHGKYYYIVTDGTHSGWASVLSFTTGYKTLHVLRINPDNTLVYETAIVPSDANVIDLKNVNFSLSGMIFAPLMFSTYQALWWQDMTNPADEQLINIAYGRPDLTGEFGANYPELGIGTLNLSNYSYKVDLDEMTYYPLNMAGIEVKSILDDNPLVGKWYDTNGAILKFNKAMNYLATINNLQTAVTKTAEKTMKVTYVLRFSDGE